MPDQPSTGIWNKLKQALLTSLIAQKQTVTEQTYVLNIYLLLAFLSVSIFGVLNIVVEGNLFVGYLELIGGAAISLIFFNLYIGRNIVLARNLLLLAILTLLIVMMITGGTRGTGIFWFFLFPVTAFFLTGKKQGLF